LIDPLSNFANIYAKESTYSWKDKSPKTSDNVKQISWNSSCQNGLIRMGRPEKPELFSGLSLKIQAHVYVGFL
jgi:hypothetical protein